jgi:hypothetical protein
MPIHTITLGGFTVRSWFLLGQLPFALTMALLLWAVRRSGASWRAACLSAAAFVAGLALGTALLPSVLGAMAGALGLWMLAQKILEVRRPPLAIAGLGLMATVAIGRWGCLLNGCCFGKVTDLPWGIHYGDTSAALVLHQALGWVAPDAMQSLAVHPYPAYESLGLLLWLPIGIWLLRHLRSQGAVLAFTAAYDLGLRAFIDGMRAMVNVWWGLLGEWLGLNLLQWGLLSSACCLVFAGSLLERRAAMRGVVDDGTARAPSIEAAWAVYLGSCAIAFFTERQQTQFLHLVVVLALALAAPALPLPSWLPLPARGRRGLGVAVAGALLVIVGLRGGDHVLAEGGLATHAGDSAVTPSKDKREWIYDVDARRGLLVRVADSATDPKVRRDRELRLGLPTEPVAAEAEGRDSDASTDASGTRKPLLWFGGGMAFGSGTLKTELATKSDSDSCSNDYRIDHRKTVAGFALAEYQLPIWEVGSLSLGTALGYLHENFDTQYDPTIAGTAGTYARSAYLGQVWSEVSHPNFAFGFGLTGDIDVLRLTGSASSPSTSSTGMPSPGFTTTTLRVHPSLHLRGGFSFLGAEMAYLDPTFASPLGSSRFGIYAAISRQGGRIHSVDQTLLRLFMGAMEYPGFPGADHIENLAAGAGLEIFIRPTLMLAVSMAGKDNMLFGGLQLRGAYSRW